MDRRRLDIDSNISIYFSYIMKSNLSPFINAWLFFIDLWLQAVKVFFNFPSDDEYVIVTTFLALHALLTFYDYKTVRWIFIRMPLSAIQCKYV